MSKILHKQFGLAKAAPTLDAATFVASTNAVDRYNDVVDQSWDLSAYNANPVIQIDHSYRVEDTVGRGAARVEAGQLLVEITWGKDAKSQAIAQKVMDGLISAVSVGFMAGRSVPRSSLPSTDPLFSQEWGYVHYDNQLLEVSVVAIPANQEALAQRGVGTTINIDSVVEQVLARLVTAQTLSQPSTQDKPVDFLSLSLNEVKL